MPPLKAVRKEDSGLVYPGRKVHDVLPQFAGTNVVRPTAEQRAELLAFVAQEYPTGRSLRELAELTGRTQSAIRRALDQAGVLRRGPGASAISGNLDS
jgi:Helix-turn-helix domain